MASKKQIAWRKKFAKLYGKKKKGSKSTKSKTVKPIKIKKSDYSDLERPKTKKLFKT
jgi:hypothetical protein|tara:strand:+ start:278 stop:448 length:171 start_codon:yes stop_codon:yes gene_type:complete